MSRLYTSASSSGRRLDCVTIAGGLLYKHFAARRHGWPFIDVHWCVHTIYVYIYTGEELRLSEETTQFFLFLFRDIDIQCEYIYIHSNDTRNYVKQAYNIVVYCCASRSRTGDAQLSEYVYYY